jgi:hypothetical protein
LSSQQDDANHQTEKCHKKWGKKANPCEEEKDSISKGDASGQISEPGWQVGLQKGDAEE